MDICGAAEIKPDDTLKDGNKKALARGCFAGAECLISMKNHLVRSEWSVK
jgi:hypothetical protein